MPRESFSGHLELLLLAALERDARHGYAISEHIREASGGRFDYEVKYTIESKRFDALAPALRKSLDSFGEVPGPVPAAGNRKAA